MSFRYTIKVEKHKTASTHGPVQVTLDAELYTMLQNYEFVLVACFIQFS